MSKSLLTITVLGCLAFAAFFISPSPIDAEAYQPPKAPPLIGHLQVNDDLLKTELLGKGLIQGPEDVDVDEQGRTYGATADGKIVRINKDGIIETLINTGGRPLGLEWDSQGNLIICDAFKGLLSLNPEGKLTTLLTEVDGIPLMFTDDLEIADDGMIYFSDASTKYDQKHYMLDMMEARPWGRLIRYDPVTKEAKTLLSDLYFANGIALSKNQDFILINETYRYRVTQLWIEGPQAGQKKIFIENLPGFPDGISSSGRGTFWVALPTTRNSQADGMHPYPWIKNQIAKLPESMRPKPEMYGLILELSESGEVLRSLHDPTGKHFPFITSVQERGDAIYLGTLIGDSIGKLALDTALKSGESTFSLNSPIEL